MSPFFWTHYSLFALQSLTLLALFLSGLGIALLLLRSGRRKKTSALQVVCLNQEYLRRQLQLARETWPKKKVRQWLRKQKTSHLQTRPKLFVLSFKGDVQAQATRALSRAISVILPLAGPKDEVLLRLESPGGLVHAYGEAAGELVRVKRARIPLKVAVDRVAASGGYLMAAVADEILAAPFALLGSIGVVAQLPNFHRYLKEKGIDFELLTAGEYKRTLTLFGENNEKGREKAQEQLEETHRLFQDFIQEQRPGLNLEKVATGEYWYGQKALEMGLADQIMGSEEYLQTAAQEWHILELRPAPLPGKWTRWLGRGLEKET